jgi:hypothetical protein
MAPGSRGRPDRRQITDLKRARRHAMEILNDCRAGQCRQLSEHGVGGLGPAGREGVDVGAGVLALQDVALGGRHAFGQRLDSAVHGQGRGVEL